MERLARAFGRHASSDDEHVEILIDIGRLVRIASEEADLDDVALMERLVSAGVARRRAWRLVTFVPLAFGRYVLEEMNIQVQATYLQRNDRGRDTRRRLRDEPEFRAAADHLLDFSERPGFKELAGRSAEIDALSNALKAGDKPENGTMAEVVTWESSE